jgi:diguanylate cyclase (GGDEF)-like protein
LTGVYLLLAGLAQLERERERANRTGDSLVIAFIDVDQLKTVNDRHGHAAGDDLLRAVAVTLRSHLRTEDVIFRYGGDEFLRAFVGLTTIDAATRIEDVQRTLNQRPERGSVSAGISQLHALVSPDDLIRRLMPRSTVTGTDTRTHDPDNATRKWTAVGYSRT